MKVDAEAQREAWDARIEAMKGTLECRCALCPEWVGHSVEEHQQHMHLVHDRAPVSKEGKYDHRCPTCMRTFWNDIPTSRYCSDDCRPGKKPAGASKAKVPRRSHPYVPPTKAKACVDCGKEFVPHAGAVRRCPPCRVAYRGRKAVTKVVRTKKVAV